MNNIKHFDIYDKEYIVVIFNGYKHKVNKKTGEHYKCTTDWEDPEPRIIVLRGKYTII